MITPSEETWATNTLRDAQDPGAGKQSWPPLTRITLERFNLIFSQVESRGYGSTGQPQHDAGTVLENSLATLFKVALVSGDLKLTKWSVAGGLTIDDVTIVASANISVTASPSMELTAGVQTTIRVFYVDEDDDYIHYIASTNGGASFGAEQNVGAAANVIAIASVSPTKLHWISFEADGNCRFHCYEDTGSWASTDSLIYWPHEIEHIDAITIGDRDLIVFYSEGPMFGKYRTAGIYGIWYEHGRWSDIFKIDVLDEATSYSYRAYPILSTANGIYFLTGFLSEGDATYSHTDRFVKSSKDGEHWRQYMPLVCAEGGPAKLLVLNAASGQSWPWSTGQQCYIAGYDKVYESDATRFLGEVNTSLQLDVTNRTLSWELNRGIVAQASTVLGNHDGVLDNHVIINEDNTLALIREAGYYTSEEEELAQLTLEEVDVVKETDRLPHRHKQVISRDRMKWARDNEADHVEERESQLVGYDIYHDNTETGYGGLSHTATQHGWWETHGDVLWLRSNNKEGLTFATWGSEIMNGQAKALLRLEKAANAEYAGVVFRARDDDNFWTAYYDQTTDKIILKQKVGGAWQGVMASSATLSWTIDTWYGIMVDFRYSYFRVFYSTDLKNWTQAFTYIAGVDQIAGAFEYGYCGLIGYGYCDEDSDDAAGLVAEYDPPVGSLPTIPLASSSDMIGAGGLVYFLDTTTGRLFRTRNALESDPTKVVYEDLGVIDASAKHFALASWDPLNTAMAVGDDGIWRCLNLNSDDPTWTQVVDLTVYDDAGVWICSSPKRRRWWSVCGYHYEWYYDEFYEEWLQEIKFSWVRESKGSNGTSWTRYELIPEGTSYSEGSNVRCEMSSHTVNKSWVFCTNRVEGAIRTKMFYTNNGWGSYVEIDVNPWDWWNNVSNCQAPIHPYLQNAFDNKMLLCMKNPYPDGYNRVCVGYTEEDYVEGPPPQYNLTHIPLTEGYPLAFGSCPWQNFSWVVLYSNTSERYEFWASKDRITWTMYVRFSMFTDAVKCADVYPSDPNIVVCGNNGTNHPLKVSSDGGKTFQEQTGNWGDLGYTGDIVEVKMVSIG